MSFRPGIFGTETILALSQGLLKTQGVEIKRLSYADSKLVRAALMELPTIIIFLPMILLLPGCA